MADECEEDLDIDFRRLKRDHLKVGYVEGLQAGEESLLQQGFNEGFTDSVSIVLATSELMGSISAVLSYIKSKTTQDKRELTKEVFKLKLEVEALEQRTLNEYEIFVTQQDRYDASNSENTFTDDTSLKQKLRDKDNRCLANNTNSGCCSEKQPSPCGTNCCLENTNGRNTTELEETKSKTPSVAGSKEAITIIRDKFHKDVEKIQKQLTYLIEKELFE